MQTPSHVLKLLLVLAIAAPIEVANASDIGSTITLDQLEKISKNLERLTKEQNEAVIETQQLILDAKTPGEAETASLNAERSKKDLEALEAAQNLLDSGETPPPDRLRVIEEVIRWASRKVWVMCQGRPWMADEVVEDYGPYFEKNPDEVRLQSLATGRISTYDRLESEPHKLRQVVGSAVAIGPNHIVTNKHVILSSRIGYESLTGAGEIQLYSSIFGRISFPVEYNRCDPDALDIQSVVDIEAIEFTHPTLDFVIARVSSDLPSYIEFPSERDHVVGDRIAVIGYTTRPGDADTFLSPVQLDDVFRAPDGRIPFPVQRVAEGFSIVNDGVENGYFRYDATTWGGNSGSIVIDLTTGKVLGLHARGLQSSDQGTGYNEAISSEQLAEAISSIDL